MSLSRQIVQFSIQKQLLDINVQRFRGGHVFKARRRWYHSTLGLADALSDAHAAAEVSVDRPREGGRREREREGGEREREGGERERDGGEREGGKRERERRDSFFLCSRQMSRGNCSRDKSVWRYKSRIVAVAG